MADIVRRTEDLVEVNILLLSYVINQRLVTFCWLVSRTQGIVVSFKENSSGRIGSGRIISGSYSCRTFCCSDIGILNEHRLLCCGELAIVPVSDSIVETVFLLTDGYLLVGAKSVCSTISIVSIAVWHHIQQLHLTM